MAISAYKYIYGPVSSWRLGSSIGIDIISQKNKVCNFDCIYCQLGRTKPCSVERKTYVSTKELIKELKKLPPAKIDYLTFSGSGEPTLAKNLGDVIREIKKIKPIPVAVLTNSSLINKKKVQKELALADYVMLKLDAGSNAVFKAVNKPIKSISFAKILAGLKEFRKKYNGIFALQLMFMKENKNQARKIAKIAKEIKPDIVQINTPLRSCDCNPLSKKEIQSIAGLFSGLKIITVYDTKKKKIKPINKKDTLQRRGAAI